MGDTYDKVLTKFSLIYYHSKYEIILNFHSKIVYDNAMKVPLASTGLRAEDISAAISVLNSGNLTMGERVSQFESQMASYLNVKHFVMMNSGSSANLAIIEGLLRPTIKEPYLVQGDGVLVPAIAWPTTIWPLIQLGLKPCFVDVEKDTLAIDLEKAQALINNNKGLIKAIFPIHPIGYGIDSARLMDFSNKNNLILVNDVCESLGSWKSGKHAGTSGIAGSFSFYFSHHITTMEGGGVSTNDDLFADDLRSIRSHGWSRNRLDAGNWHKDKSVNESKFLFVSTGYNIRPMEIQAAIGISQLKDIDYFVNKRKQNALKFYEVVEKSDIELIGAETLKESHEPRLHSWMMLPILLRQNFNKPRQEVIASLNSFGIETRPVLTGNFLRQPSMERISKGAYLSTETNVADLIAANAFMIGNHHDFSDEQIDLVLEAFKEILK
jgi:CDP-6-deoxy-D-xylo-4-hexulose-3-dehydrase